jgi:hypothetical protein
MTYLEKTIEETRSNWIEASIKWERAASDGDTIGASFALNRLNQIEALLQSLEKNLEKHRERQARAQGEKSLAARAAILTGRD